MVLILSSENVVDFLKEHKICSPDFQSAVPPIRTEGTNFNLIVKSIDSPHFLVKQNRLNSQGNTSGSLSVEWVVQKLVNNFSNLAAIQPLISQVVFLDWANQILVSIFYDNHLPLNSFYQTRQSFEPKIARVLGVNIAKVHRATYQQQQQREFLGRYLSLNDEDKRPNFIKRLQNLNPSLFGKICPDGLDFYRLYQRFPSLDGAVSELYEHIQPSCLIHNDLTIDNFIIDTQINFDSDSVDESKIKIIDWERIDWGDPAVDLGMVVAEYIGGIWLGSLVSDRNIDINTMLRLATVPLETLVPSLKALMQGYLTQFPEIINHRSDFISRVVQFAGIGILDRLSYYVEHHYPFHNNSLFKLQVAKNLLCSPQQQIETIFGATEAQLKGYCYQTALI